MKKTNTWKILHIVIIINFILQILYGAYQVFIINTYGGNSGILFRSATTVPREEMTIRRLYAIETWIAIVGLSVYLAIVYRDKLQPSPPKLEEN